MQLPHRYEGRIAAAFRAAAGKEIGAGAGLSAPYFMRRLQIGSEGEERHDHKQGEGGEGGGAEGLSREGHDLMSLVWGWI